MQTVQTNAVMVGFVEEMASIDGIEKTADMEAALKGLLVGGALGAGVTFGGAKLIIEMIKKNKKFAALIGGVLGASLGAGAGLMMPSSPAASAGPQVIQTGPYSGLPVGTRYSDVVT